MERQLQHDHREILSVIGSRTVTKETIEQQLDVDKRETNRLMRDLLQREMIERNGVGYRIKL